MERERGPVPSVPPLHVLPRRYLGMSFHATSIQSASGPDVLGAWAGGQQHSKSSPRSFLHFAGGLLPSLSPPYHHNVLSFLLPLGFPFHPPAPSPSPSPRPPPPLLRCVAPANTIFPISCTYTLPCLACCRIDASQLLHLKDIHPHACTGCSPSYQVHHADRRIRRMPNSMQSPI